MIDRLDDNNPKIGIKKDHHIVVTITRSIDSDQLADFDVVQDRAIGERTLLDLAVDSVDLAGVKIEQCPNFITEGNAL